MYAYCDVMLAWVELFQEGWWGKRFSNVQYQMVNLGSVGIILFDFITMIIISPQQLQVC